MIMTAELNSHQRVSYYTGVKLIRHHQSASSANPNTNNNNSNSTSTSTSSNNANNTSSNSSTSPGQFYHQHPNHYPPHPPHPHHHHHQQHPPPHHPGHFHLPCPTGPPHIQHPGGVLHLNNHHGPPHHHHPHHNGHHQYGGGGSNQTTRLYTGSPLIRSTGYHPSSSISSGGVGGLGSNKRAFKGHQHRNNHIIHHNHHSNSRSGGIGIGNPSHYLNQSIIGGSCSSGTSSSSSSNEHLNIQSPTGSPLTQAKLDITPLKLSPSPTILNGESSSSNNSSPGPQSSPSPSTASNLSTSSSSSSPNSSDGNKDLDHFYFLDEHWKPSSDGISNSSGIGGITHADILDLNSSISANCAPWTSSGSSGSPSPHTVTSATASTTLTMMVDQFFANGRNNYGSVDGNNNFIGINRDGLMGGGGGDLLRDSNNNIIGGQQPDFNEIHSRNDRFPNNYSGFSGNNVNSGNEEGASGLFTFGAIGGAAAKFNGIQSSSSTTATTVVNVETQIGTFNGQRDLEIRLCFIKGDHHTNVHNGGLVLGENHHQSQIDSHHQYPAIRNAAESMDGKTVTVIGDPFKSSRPEQSELQSSASSSDCEMDNKGASSATAAAIGMPTPKNKEIAQNS